MTVARAAAVGALALAVAVVAWVLLRGDGQHEYKLIFQTAGQLVGDNDVQVGGRRVGSVTSIELTPDSKAQVTIKVRRPYAPLHEGTTATIRATSLSGVANRYIALSPGPENAPKLVDGATIGEDRTTTIVDIDQLFNTFDEPTREGLSKVIRGFGQWYAGRGTQANAATRYFGPALSQTRKLLEKLNADSAALDGLVTNTSSVVAALGSQGATLTDLVSNSNATLGAIGDENASLAQALAELPATLRRGSTTFVNLRSTLDDLDELVAVSKPATKNLAPFLATLRPLLQEAQPTISGLAKLARQPGPSNDLTDLLSDAPGLAKVAQPAFQHSIQAINKSLPVLSFIRPYAPDFVGWVRDFGQGAKNYDANGHFARVAPVFNAFRYDATTNTIKPVAPGERRPGLENGAQVVPRCPGSSIQVPADGSAPWRDSSGTLDCNPSIVPPGP